MIGQTFPRPTFLHLKRLTTKFGLQEHALLDVPRPEHGYCVDDVARGLILLCREPELDSIELAMLELYLDFTLRAVSEDGGCHNRMDSEGNWADQPGRGDWWGRAMWGLGFAAAHAPLAGQRLRAVEGFHTLARTTSPDLKSLSFASLGAGELLLAYPDNSDALSVLKGARKRLARSSSTHWIWPEKRLSYSNGSVAEAVILIGWVLGDAPTLAQGISMLEFLLDIEMSSGHFSVTPVDGRGDDGGMSFDQQPIEIAAIADACARAFQVTGEARWAEKVQLAWSWFLGNNDRGVAMFDPETGGGYDGLHDRGPNLNQGAESTISMLSTAQQALKTSLSGP
ncbi:MAG TPA: glycosyltransferase [Candidatus Paceibacterota bacterium]|nr:glycosyltransferase [Candidatus Paceibacterota bacterium]